MSTDTRAKARKGTFRTLETADDTCANCGHPSESHNAGRGKCYSCPAAARCMKFVAREQCGSRPGMNPDGPGCSLEPGHRGEHSWSLTREEAAPDSGTNPQHRFGYGRGDD